MFRDVKHDLLGLKDAATLRVAGPVDAEHLVYLQAGFPCDPSSLEPLAAALLVLELAKQMVAVRRVDVMRAELRAVQALDADLVLLGATARRQRHAQDHPKGR